MLGLRPKTASATQRVVTLRGPFSGCTAGFADMLGAGGAGAGDQMEFLAKLAFPRVALVDDGDGAGLAVGWIGPGHLLADHAPGCGLQGRVDDGLVAVVQGDGDRGGRGRRCRRWSLGLDR